MEQTCNTEKGKGKAFWKKGHLSWTFKERIVFQISKGRKRTPDEVKSILQRDKKMFLIS